MNAQAREHFRHAILRVLEERASDRFGLAVPAIQVFLGQYGFRSIAKDVLTAELQYLEDKKFTAPVGKIISPENRYYRITAEGRDYLASNE